MHTSNPKGMIYFGAFILLVAVLSSFFARWGTEAVGWMVIGVVVVVLSAPIVFRFARKHWGKAITSEPSKLAFALAPSGYRRDRLRETEEEYVAQTVVIPTPNRPLVLAGPSPAQRALADNGSHAKQLYEMSQGRPDASKALVPAKSRSIESVQVPSRPVLKLSPECTPCIDSILGHSILGVGMRGSGKTSLAALMIEQIGEHPIPMAIFDYEEDYITLPSVLKEMCVIAGSPDWGEADRYGDGYWEVTPENADEIGYEILERGLQMVVEIGTYATLEDAASAMTGIIKGMFAWADDHDPDQRVPCLVFLDEAQHFLPQDNSVSNIAGKQEANDLLKAFMDVNARGRKRGFTLAVFTQRIAQIRKEVIAGSEIYFFGKQTMDNDLNRYEDIVGKNKLDRVGIQTLKAGTFAVFEGGEIFFTQMHTRKSEHRGKTPGLENAIKRYANRSVTTQKIRSVQTVNFDDEIDTDPGYEDIENDDGYPFSPSRDIDRQPETPKTLVPVMPDKGIRTDDLPTNTLVAIWNTIEDKTVDGLSLALSCNRNQAYKAYKRIKVCFNAALEEEE
jgi:ATPase family associated with various cellular activities (AAA).